MFLQRMYNFFLRKKVCIPIFSFTFSHVARVCQNVVLTYPRNVFFIPNLSLDLSVFFLFFLRSNDRFGFSCVSDSLFRFLLCPAVLEEHFISGFLGRKREILASGPCADLPFCIHEFSLDEGQVAFHLFQPGT